MVSVWEKRGRKIRRSRRSTPVDSDTMPVKAPRKKKEVERNIYADPYLDFRERMMMKMASEFVANVQAPVMPEIVLYLTDPSENSDKEYRLRIVESTQGTTVQGKTLPNNRARLYSVEYANGKRGCATKFKRKDTGTFGLPLDGAKKLFDEVVAEKKKKGYTTNTSGKPFSK